MNPENTTNNDRIRTTVLTTLNYFAWEYATSSVLKAKGLYDHIRYSINELRKTPTLDPTNILAGDLGIQDETHNSYDELLKTQEIQPNTIKIKRKIMTINTWDSTNNTTKEIYYTVDTQTDQKVQLEMPIDPINKYCLEE